MSLAAEDMLAILDLVARADDAATRRDVEGYVALFTPDGVLDGAQGDYAGRAALRAATQDVWAREASTSRHLTANPVVVQGETGDTAVVTSTLVILAGAAPELVAVADIRQEIMRTSEGWLITHRHVG